MVYRLLIYQFNIILLCLKVICKYCFNCMLIWEELSCVYFTGIQSSYKKQIVTTKKLQLFILLQTEWKIISTYCHKTKRFSMVHEMISTILIYIKYYFIVVCLLVACVMNEQQRIDTINLLHILWKVSKNNIFQQALYLPLLRKG